MSVTTLARSENKAIPPTMADRSRDALTGRCESFDALAQVHDPGDTQQHWH
jgi:hypothetical protein